MLESLFPREVVFVRATDAMAEEPLHPAEAERTDRMAPKRLREYSAGRACARHALSRLGIRDFPLLSESNRAPIWPEGVVGSITHCKGFCAAVAARCATIVGIGLDAELAEPLDAELIDRICTPADRSHCAGLPRVEGNDWHKVVFSAKESLYKCYYPLAGHFLGFHDAEIALEPEAGRFVARLVDVKAPAAAGARTFRGRFLLAGPHVVTAVTLGTGN